MGHLKSLYHSKKIDLYLWVRPVQDQNIVFLTEFGENPPVATAINLRHIEDCSNQLDLLSECLRSVTEQDRKRTCILEYSRGAWTIKLFTKIKYHAQVRALNEQTNIDKLEISKRKAAENLHKITKHVLSLYIWNSIILLYKWCYSRM